MTLLIDNYDSFSYNLYQMLGEIDPEITVIRNDEWSVEKIAEFKPDRIVISPGPGRPEDAGIIIDLIQKITSVPVLGVCLGHQAICAAFGATIGYAKTLMHGKQSMVTLAKATPLFEGLAETFPVARYHSLAAEPATLPATLEITATTADGEIMAVQHKTEPIYGLQFHPESILTPNGNIILANFLKMKAGTRND